MNRKDRIDSMVKLGSFLRQFTTKTPIRSEHELNTMFYSDFENLLLSVSKENRWFTPENVRESINGICEFLQENALQEWLNRYPVADANTKRRIAVIMAGNIPMVGFHDMLCVLMCGHQFIGKLSSKDNQLLDFIAKLLSHIHPEFTELIQFRSDRLSGNSDFDAIIATGSNNSARYFDAYFSKYPNIIRRNRNSLAVLTGNESDDELKALGKDIFLYYGLGCRNVSKLYLPENYNIPNLLDQWADFSGVIDNSKYANNYDYQRSLLLMNKIPHYDNGFILLRENAEIASPIGLVNYEFYSELHDLKQITDNSKESIQCIVSSDFEGALPLGTAQYPKLWDYADNVDTMKFLTELK